MTAWLLPSGLALWVGLSLLLHRLRWFSRPRLEDRLGPYVPGGMGVRPRVGLLSAESFAQAVGPLARSLGDRVSRLFGVGEELHRRLRRIHAEYDVTAFRVRQVAWSLCGLAIGTLVALVAPTPPAVAVLFVVGGALLAFLVVEQQVARASDAWKRALFLELPVVSEQTAMLLGAGFSLNGALERVATRGQGAVASDLERVLRRVRQGLDTETALREWADLADVDAVTKFVAVLSLNREATDLGRLLTEEARAIRRDVQRELVETMERRAQQVWIPVAVATLVPGVIFLAIPFMAALRSLDL
ncbi:type II secretion system F family protein [Salsipaludibacter albus]|uniref:type II secretion system F family protein n=1 Tax=Salsipaludibacter albus TaxID=2849650 RepID=UPI001EE3C828|nr:type II secretion system F family protein [Salsipaludibacter albus]MBY5163106.1 type II secretion system F family protein [Salsipaludibacter albus]